jgi:hypothetical protein
MIGDAVRPSVARVAIHGCQFSLTGGNVNLDIQKNLRYLLPSAQNMNILLKKRKKKILRPRGW